MLSASPVIKEFAIPPVNNVSSSPFLMTTGSDGNVWFADQGTDSIGKVTPAGTITEYSIPYANSQPSEITTGADGNVWFTSQSNNAIGKVTPAGTITEYGIDGGATGITAGPGGKYLVHGRCHKRDRRDHAQRLLLDGSLSGHGRRRAQPNDGSIERQPVVHIDGRELHRREDSNGDFFSYAIPNSAPVRGGLPSARTGISGSRTA